MVLPFVILYFIFLVYCCFIWITLRFLLLLFLLFWLPFTFLFTTLVVALHTHTLPAFLHTTRLLRLGLVRFVDLVGYCWFVWFVTVYCHFAVLCV